MAENTIKVRSAFEDSTTAGVNKMNRDLQRGFKKSEDSAKGLSSGLKTVAKAAGGLFVFTKIIRFLGNSVKAYDKQVKAETQLAVALGRTSKALTDQASALQKITLFGDEATIEAQALIAAFVKEEDQIKKVIPLVQDLATAKKMDLSSAADLVSKTLGSSTNALIRYGIHVEGAVGSTERLDSLTRSLEKAFGGSAEAAAKAGAGPLKQFSNIIGDISEDIGELLLPLLVDVAGQAGETANAFTGIVGVFAGALGVIKLFQVGLSSLGFVLIAIFEAWINLIGILPDKLLPEGWGEGIDNTIEATANLRNVFKIAMTDMSKDALKYFKVTHKAFGGVGDAIEDVATKTGGKKTPTKTTDPDGLADSESKRLQAVADIAKDFRQLEFDERQRDHAKLQEWYNKQLAIIGVNEHAQFALFEIFKSRESDIEENFRLQQIESEAQSLQAAFDIKRVFQQLGMDEREKELSDLENWYTDQAGVVGDNQQAQLDLFEIYKARELDITKKYNDEAIADNERVLKRQQEIELLKLSVASDVFGSMSDLLKTAGKEQKEFAALSKGLAIIEATIDTYVGAQKAFNSFAGLGPVGYGLGVAAAAATIITGLARVATIASLNAETGLIVPGNQFTGDRIQVGVNSREGIFTLEQQQTLFDIAAGRTQPGRSGSIDNVTMNFYGDTTEQTTEDMIERLDDLMSARELSGIA